jgi:hypothetical protein
MDRVKVASINHSDKQIIVFNDLFKSELQKLVAEHGSLYDVVSAEAKRAAKRPVKKSIKECDLEF